MVDRSKHTVLMTTDTVGGVWTYAVSLIRAMEQYPVNFVLATIGPLPNKQQQKDIAHLSNVRVESYKGKLEWMDDPWNDLEAEAEWLQKLSTTYQPDLVHLNHYGHGTLDFNAPKLLTMHSCVKSWWRAVKGEQVPDHWSRYGTVVQEAIMAADEVVVPSHSVLQQFRKEYAGLEKATVIYNGINPAQYKAEKKDKFIFSMGRLWDEAKNIALLLEAAEYVDFPIVIAGGKGESFGRSMPDNVTMLGWQSREEIISWLSRAPVYVLPVKYEPFGLSFLEAAASGCALIGGKISTLEELWGDSALLCNSQDPRELAKLINILMKDHVLLKDMQQKPLTRSCQYHLSNTARYYFDKYKTMNSIFADYEY